jgi:hypothetical protein
MAAGKKPAPRPIDEKIWKKFDSWDPAPRKKARARPIMKKI